MFRYRLLIGLLLYTSVGRAQIFGGTPPSVHWNAVQTIPAKIIYPPGLEHQAQQVAFLVNELSKKTLPTIGSRQKSVDIVFHNLTIIPNGYVQWAPFRSEFQLTPEQNSFDLGSLPWNQTLAIHEYRHVQQFNNFCVGLSKAFYILFGQDGLAFANSLAVPNWLFEGDAVFQETLVSQQGRGRLPLFLTGYESLWVSEKKYSWMKLRNGSYRDYIPNHYPLGYMLVAYGREKYGANFWAKTAVQAAAFKGLFYPLQKSIQRNAGVSFDQFRTNALDYFHNQLPASAYETVEAKFGRDTKHFAADELFPQFTDANNILLLNSSYRQPPFFAELNPEQQKTERVKFRAVSLDDAFSYRNHQIVYAAYEPDLRWGWIDYSVIRVLDLKTKKDRRLTSKTKYFAPDISPDGLHVAAANQEQSGRSRLDILDIHTGNIQKTIPNPHQYIYTYPKYYSSEELVSAVRDQRGAMNLLKIKITTGEETVLSEWSMDPLGFLSVDSPKIYFTRTYEGVDQGFYYDRDGIHVLKQNANAGNYQVTGSFGKIAWTSFTSAGYRLQQSRSNLLFSADTILFPSIDSLEKHKVYALDNPPFQLPAPFPDSLFPTNSYSATTHLFNFHSWRPYINDPDFTLSLLGQNVLNTFQSEIYVGYNRNEEYKKVGADFTYGGWFPFVNLGTEYRIDRNGYYNSQKVYWNEWIAYTGLSVPLNFSRGRWFTTLEGGSNITYHQNIFQSNKDSLPNSHYLSLDPQLLFVHQLQAAQMQIYPSFAQTISLQYNRAITNISGNQFLATGNFYFPGFTTTNSLVFRASFQQRDSLNQIRFSNSFPFSRGYTGVNFYQMYGFGINYNLPVAYPDWGFANLIYFLRIRANAFYDYTGVPYYATNGPGVSSAYRSYGMEIYLDTKWWNQLALTFGIRYSRLLDADYQGRGPNQWELILPINILDKGYSNRLSNL